MGWIKEQSGKPDTLAIYLGDEAFVNPAKFSLDGRPIRKVRQSVTRLEKAGYRVELSAPDDIQPELREELLSVSEEWRGNWPERGFTMAMDALFAYPDTVLAIATFTALRHLARVPLPDELGPPTDGVRA